MKTLEKNSSTISKNHHRNSFIQKKGDKGFISSPLQTKLNVGKSNDVYEKEADSVADKIVADSPKEKQPNIQRKPLADSITPFVQKKEDENSIQKQEDETAQTKIEDEKPIQKQESETAQTKIEDEKPIQKQEDQTAQTKVEDKKPIQKQEDEATQTKVEKENLIQKKENPSKLKDSHQFVEDKLKNTKGQGSPLSTEVRQMLEVQFGVDLSGVRIHTNENASQMSRALGAMAFTNGKDIYFNEGKFNPHTSDGKHLLAHELTHTIQQGAVSEKAKTADTFEEISHVQLSEMLDNAIRIAQGEKGKVNAKAKNPDGTRLGHERLLEYFKTAFGPNWDGSLEPNIKTESTTFSQMEGRERDKMPSWCGIFIWWAYKQAGIPITDWKIGKPLGESIGNYPAPHTPKPGDIGQKAMFQHFAMVVSSDGQNVTSINGNTAGSDNLGGQIEEKTEPIDAFAAYFNPLGGNLDGSTPFSPAEEDLPVERIKVIPKKSDIPFAEPTKPTQDNTQKTLNPKDKKVDKLLKKQKKQSVVDEKLATKDGVIVNIGIAPKSPEEDPIFQKHIERTTKNAKNNKKHDPASQKSDEVAAAAVAPTNEVTSKAQDKQTEDFDAQEPKIFDAAGFKAALKAKLEEITPKNLDEAQDFKESGKTNEVKNAANEGVKKEKENTADPIEEKNNKVPDTTGIEPKSVTPLPEMPAGQKPVVVGGKGAAPKKKADSEISMAKESGELDQKLEQNNISEAQLQNSNEPSFQKASESKNSAQTQVKQSEIDYRKDEKTILNKAEHQADSSTHQVVASIFGEKKKSITNVSSQQIESKSKDEQAREKVATEIDKIFQKTKNKVDTTLTKLETDVNLIFDTGASLAKENFEKDVDKKMSDYKDARYSGVRGKARWVRDKFLDLPSEVNRFYEESRAKYIADMDVVIDTVANIVATQLAAAKKAVNDGKQEIKDYVKSLPKNLQKVGKEAADNIQGKFDELEQNINDKQNELVDNLAQKYKENLEQVDARINEMKEANKGLLTKAKEAIEGVIKTISELKDMLFNILAKAASVIDKIITDPIGFLKNLVAGVKMGLDNFGANIWSHLQNGFIGWLTGELAEGGIQMPQTWDLKGIFSFIMQLIGLTWQNIRTRAVKKLGEPVVKTLESAFDIFMVVKNEGLAGLWNYVKEKIDDLKTTVWDAIQNFLIEKVVQAGITWIIGLLNPAAAFIKACKLIYDIIIFFVENSRRLLELLNAIVDSVIDIANGALGGAAKKVEDALAKTLPIAIGFLASLLGINGLGKKVKEIINKVRKPINRAIDWVLDKAIKFAKKLGLDKMAKKVKAGVKKGKDWAKKKTKKIIAKIFQWWKMKTGFVGADKKNHSIYFKGSQKNAKLIVASIPTPIEVYLNKIDVGKDATKKEHRDEAIKIAKLIHKETDKTFKGKDEAKKAEFEKSKKEVLESEFRKLKYRLEKLPPNTEDSGNIPEILKKYFDESVFKDETTNLKGDFLTALTPTNYNIVKADFIIRRNPKSPENVPQIYIGDDGKLKQGAERKYVPQHSNYKPDKLKITQQGGVYKAEFLTKTYDGKVGPSYEVEISFEEVTAKTNEQKETRKVTGKSLVFKPEGNPRGKTDSASSGFDNAHLIGDRFGGTGFNEGLNIYPSSPNYNRETMLGVEDKMASLVKNDTGHNLVVTAIIKKEKTTNLDTILHDEFKKDNASKKEISQEADTKLTQKLRAAIAKDIEDLPGQFLSVNYTLNKPGFPQTIGEDTDYEKLKLEFSKKNVNSGTTTETVK